ncbi:hypothetical protein ACFSW8_02760 [Rubritalea tangerina]|uniref:Dicarboxylate transport domain-containing protein n=1 Tax=Rubritalea tangerina TaxID=430798 RepID=A0ABW4Z7G1_9BACT
MKRRRLWRRLFYWVCVPVFGIFTVGNIVLNSAWSKNEVARQLERRTGEKWKVGTITYGFDGRLHIYQLSCELGEGGLNVGHIEILPNYGLLWEGEKRISRVTIRKPELLVTDMWLLERLQEYGRQPAVIAQTDRAAAPAIVQNESIDGEGQESGHVEGEIKSGLVVNKKIEVRPGIGDVPIGNHAPGDDYESWLVIEDAQISVKGRGGSLVSLTDFDANLPVGGADLTGEVAWGGLSVLGYALVEEGSFRMSKRGGLLSIKETEVDFFGLSVLPTFYLGRSSGGIAFLVDMVIPEQEVEEILTHLNLEVDIGSDKIVGRMRLGGIVSQPMSWRGAAEILASGIHVKEGHRGTMAHFESCALRSYFGRGRLYTPQIELRGDAISVMGNGVVEANGAGYGVLRVVTSPEKRGWINRLANGSNFFVGLRGGVMQPLDTNDMYYCDLLVDGGLLDPVIKLENKTDWQPLWESVSRLKQFIKSERAEDQRAFTKGQK